MSTAQLLQLGDGGKSLAGSARGWAGMHPVQLGSSPSTQLLISLSLCCPETSPGLKSPQSPAWAARAAQFPPRDATRAGSWLLQAQRRGTDSHHSPAGHVWAGNATDTLLPSPTALHEVRTLLFGGDAGLPTLALGLWVPASLAPFLLLPPCIPTASRSPRLAEPGAVPEPRRAAPGDQLPLRARCHPPVLPALRGHLPLLHSAQALQEQPLLSHRGKQPCRVFGVHGWFPTLWLFGDGPRPALVKASLSAALQLRKLVSDFSIILAILIFCAIDVALGLETPKLLVPSELKVTGGWGIGSALQEVHAGQGLWALPGLLGTQRSPGTAGWGKTPGQGAAAACARSQPGGGRICRRMEPLLRLACSRPAQARPTHTAGAGGLALAGRSLLAHLHSSSTVSSIVSQIEGALEERGGRGLPRRAGIPPL